MKLIDKDALVAEIEKWISGWTERLNTNPSNSSFFEGGIEVGKYILSFIDTLEVKEIGIDIGSREGDLGRKTVRVIDADGNISEVMFTKSK